MDSAEPDSRSVFIANGQSYSAGTFNIATPPTGKKSRNFHIVGVRIPATWPAGLTSISLQSHPDLTTPDATLDANAFLNSRDENGEVVIPVAPGSEISITPTRLATLRRGRIRVGTAGAVGTMTSSDQNVVLLLRAYE